MKIPIKEIILETMLSTEDKLGLGMKIFTPGQLPSQNMYDINKRKHNMIHKSGMMGMSSMKNSHASRLNLSPLEFAHTQNDLRFINGINPIANGR